MEENQTNEIVNSDESRRSFMKKGALASGAVALGVGSTETVAAETTLQPSEILVFAYDYNPNLSFEPITTLQQGTTNGILSQIDSIGNSDDSFVFS